MSLHLTSRRRARILIAAAFAALSAAVACDGGPTEPSTPVARIDLSGTPAENALLLGGTAQLSAVVRDAGGAVLERRVTWSSSDPAVLQVSPTGLVTAVAPGVAVIGAAAGGEAEAVALAVRVSVPVPAAGAGAPVSTSVPGAGLLLTLPPGATTAPAVTFGRAAVASDDARVLAATAFAIGPAGVTFTTPATVEVNVNLAALPLAKRAALRVFRLTDADVLEAVPASSVDVARGVVLATLSRGGTYVVVVPGDPTLLVAAEGDSRQVAIGTAVPGVIVQARDAAGNPVFGAEVRFSLEGSGGSLAGDTVAVTDAEGRATLPGQWFPGTSNGTYRLRARIPGTSLSVLFSALAFKPATRVSIDAAPTTGFSGVMLSEPFIITLRAADGERADVTQEVTLSLIGGTSTFTGPSTAMAVGGGAIVTGQTILGAGPVRMVVSSAGLIPDTSDVIDVTQRVRALRVVTQPAGAVSGVPFATQPVVELLDDTGLRVAAGTSQVQARTQSGTLLGTTVVTAAAGVATFTDLAIEGPGQTSLIFDALNAEGSSNVFSETVDVAPFQGIRLLVGPAPLRDERPNVTFAVFLDLDLSNRAGANLTSIDATVSWDPARFEYQGLLATGPWRDSTNADATITLDESQAAAGVLRFVGSSPSATVANARLGSFFLRVRATEASVQSSITATVQSATNDAAAAVPVAVLPMVVTVYP